MDQIISPARAIEGIVTLPGDKSISHRYGLIAAIAEGESRIANYATGADCQSTLGCMQALGAKVERRDDGVTVITGGELQAPKGDLDAGNSGTITRMLTGILAGQKFDSRIIGDESVSGRPVDRVTKPLAEMGANIELRDGRYPPIVIHGSRTKHIAPAYQRYLENFFRKRFKLEGTPIRIAFRDGENPFAGKKNVLTEGQLRKRQRMVREMKKRKR